MTGLLLDAFIYLAAAVVAVPLTKRLGLGSVLGYLLAGVIIGPVLGLVGSEESTTIQHYAEFGVVMMLFLVGLELEPAMLWRMRTRLLGLGGLQVSLTAALFTLVAWWFGTDWRSAIAIGLLLSLSSTAIVLQTFQEKGLSGSEGGRSAFSVLLFQDIAVIPMLALIPLLAIPELGSGQLSAAGAADHHDLSLVAGLSGWSYALVIVGAVGGVIVGGHFCSRPLFQAVASTGLREAFTAAALLLIIGIALLMSLVGLSPALGTFLAGVVLANSEFRHELETDIEPFKGLLLGLFFITVGAAVQFSILIEHAGLIIGLTIAVIVGKALLLYGLALLFRVRRADGWLFTLSLAQAGEFGFVLISYATQNRVLPDSLTSVLSLVVALSMFCTPLLFIAFDRLVTPRYAGNDAQAPPDSIDKHGTVIIAGSGRFGQIVNRMLRGAGIDTVVIDRTAQQIENMRAVDIRSYFGDATRPALLHAAGIEQALLFVIAIDDVDQATGLARHLRSSHPNLKILARAFDRGHFYTLKEAGVDWVVIETYHSALETGKQALTSLGIGSEQAADLASAFHDAEVRGRDILYEQWREKSEGERYGHGFRSLYIELEEALRELMQEEKENDNPQTSGNNAQD
ncbi:glutathione-regulated potassium-efflux system protein KefC [Luminiphilus syltensis NOR5-1B]|uniref:Glutathione-regulated potassium-efflux system protein KefC n=1 Tax=Luminiphilus syltensis NOR5-1B TaxID=565045 RepID=B8KRC2_9GAMM|nr:monovalent cation:proton antiporter-2 (CPA2) family protein [Luminiphilus syltensis]EED36076.1 glutathione-regulated potassium-efflux system protein KefC [Luminiphilus syltensis NOR5-1B]